jgi:hypothetical protein
MNFFNMWKTVYTILLFVTTVQTMSLVVDLNPKIYKRLGLFKILLLV